MIGGQVMDIANEGKPSYATLLGIDQSKKMVEDLTCEALEMLTFCGGNTTTLANLANILTQRKS